MQKKFDFRIAESMEVMNERIGGLLLNIGTVQANGALAAIANLALIKLSIDVHRSGKVKSLFNGYLNEYLVGMYAQSVELALNEKPFSNRHQFNISFQGGVLNLTGNDKLVVDLYVDPAAFNNLDESKSFIRLQTIPAMGQETALPIIKKYALDSKDLVLDLELGNNIDKITAAFDFTASYEASNKSKFSGLVEVTGSGYKNSMPIEAYEAKNVMYYDDNPESSVMNLVLFWDQNGNLLHNAKISGSLDKAADGAARILWRCWERV